jgi:hypothetical protein
MKNLLSIIFIFVFSLSAFGQTAVVITDNANLRGTPTEKGKVVEKLKRETPLEVLKQRDVWFLVQTIDYVGWISGDAVKLTSPLTIDTIDEIAIPKKTQNSAPPTIAQQPEPQPSKAQTTDSRTYIRGSRGGCYYINSNGKKTYVDKSLCN